MNRNAGVFRGRGAGPSLDNQQSVSLASSTVKSRKKVTCGVLQVGTSDRSKETVTLATSSVTQKGGKKATRGVSQGRGTNPDPENLQCTSPTHRMGTSVYV